MSHNYITENVLTFTKSANSCWWVQLRDDIVMERARDVSPLLTCDCKFPAACTVILFSSHVHNSLINRL